MKRLKTTHKGMIHSLLFIRKTDASSQVVQIEYNKQAMSGQRFTARSINPWYLNRA
jgi:hypothetical protein